MATTVSQVFELAIYLMNENNPTTGETEIQDTEEYQVRTLGLLNVLCQECYTASTNYEYGTDGGRPYLSMLTSMEDEIGLDDYLSRGVLPYGLAAQLLLGERNDEASFLNEKYQELLFQARLTAPATSSDITYNDRPANTGAVLGYNEFGRW